MMKLIRITHQIHLTLQSTMINLKIKTGITLKIITPTNI